MQERKEMGRSGRGNKRVKRKRIGKRKGRRGREEK